MSLDPMLNGKEDDAATAAAKEAAAATEIEMPKKSAKGRGKDLAKDLVEEPAPTEGRSITVVGYKISSNRALIGARDGALKMYENTFKERCALAKMNH